MLGFRFVTNQLGHNTLRRSCTHIVCPLLGRVQLTTKRSYWKRIFDGHCEDAEDSSQWPRKIFSGIQPSGKLHLGNYLGAIQKWTELQNANEDVSICIVDMHSVILPQESDILRDNILKLTASLLACGVDPHKSKIFLQSDVKEHGKLCWLIGTLCTMDRLGHLPQFKEKTQDLKEVPLGLFVYPVLQAADIMLYKSTHIPVGEDQVQHILLTQHLAKTFNSRFGRTFPVCHLIIDDNQVSRIRALRDPLKKMSKSDPNPKSAIYISDSPDKVLKKVKKAVTDFNSQVTFEPVERPGVSNLITIHSRITGQPIEQIIDEASSLDTGRYKLRVAEAINEHFRPIREKKRKFLENPDELIRVLKLGAEKARIIATETVAEVKHKMGLGVSHMPFYKDKESVSTFPKRLYSQTRRTFLLPFWNGRT